MQFVLRAFDKEPRQLAGLRGKDFSARKSRSSRSLRSANVEEESYEMRLGFRSGMLTRSYSWSIGMVNWVLNAPVRSMRCASGGSMVDQLAWDIDVVEMMKSCQ